MMFQFGQNYWMLWTAMGLYAASLLFALWRLTLGKSYRHWPKLALVLPGFLFHTIYLWKLGLAQGRCPVSNLFETLCVIAWCLVAMHLTITLSGKINYVTVFYMPIVLMILIAALIVPNNQTHFEHWKETSWLALHASIIILGYAAFSLAGAVGLMYLVQEGQLRRRRLSLSFMLLPPMMRLEWLLSWLVNVGFLLLSVGLLSGMFGLYTVRGNFSQIDAKLLWSLAVWLLYLMIALARCFGKINGRWMAWLSISGCLFVLTTFWMANYLSRFHHY